MTTRTVKYQSTSYTEDGTWGILADTSNTKSITFPTKFSN